MTKQIKFYQISHRLYGIIFKGLQGYHLVSVIQKIKKNGGRWNYAINHFELPLQNASNLIKEIKNTHQQIHIEDVPVQLLKNVLSPKIAQNQQKKIFYIPPKRKWNRFVLYDSLLYLRYDFIAKFVLNLLSQKTMGSTEKKLNKRVLFFCSNLMKNNWIFHSFSKNKLMFKDVDYSSFSIESHYKINITLPNETQIEIFTYQQLASTGDLFQQKVLDKYTTIICDDIDTIFDPDEQIFKSDQINKSLKNIIRDRFSADKDLILICSKLNFGKVQELIELGNYIKPKIFGLDVLQGIGGQLNDVNWMKKRYRKQNKFTRQFYYILTSTILINLQYDNLAEQDTVSSSKKDKIIHQNKVIVSIPTNSLDKFKHIDNKYRNLNRKLVISSFQGQRSYNSQIYSQNSRSEQARYIRDIRDLMINQKFPQVFAYISKLTKQYDKKIAIVVQNNIYQEKLQKYLIDQQIQYCIYEITAQDLQAKDLSYDKFNLNLKLKVCIINRQKVLKEYKQAKSDQEKLINQVFNQKMEQELALQQGGGYQLRQHHCMVMDNSIFKSQCQVELKKITTVHHLVFIDTFWYEYSKEKQKIIESIFSTKYREVDFSKINIQAQTSILSKPKQDEKIKYVSLVKHYFICKDSYQKSIFDKYSTTLMLHEDEQQNTNNSVPENQVIGSAKTNQLQQFVKKMTDEVNKKFKGKKRISTVYDIDEQFDRLEYEARKQSEKKSNQQSNSGPKWNTHIDGLVQETPCLKIKKIQQNQNPNLIKIFAKKSKFNVEDIAWLNEESAQIQSPKKQIEDNKQQEELKKYFIDHQNNIFDKPIEPKNSNQFKQDNKCNFNQSLHQKLKFQENVDDSFYSSASSIIPLTTIDSKMIKTQDQIIHTESKRQKQNLNHNQIQTQRKIIEVRQKEPQFVKFQTNKHHENIIDLETQQFSVVKSKKPQKTKINNSLSGFMFNGTDKKVLWYKKKDSTSKNIAKKYKSLKIKLIPLHSALC